MLPVQSRSQVIETLQRMTSRLAEPSLTIAEANTLRLMIHRLLEEVGQSGRSAGDLEDGIGEKRVAGRETPAYLTAGRATCCAS